MREFEWIRCLNCGHRLLMLRHMKPTDNIAISVKCPSCKKIEEIAVKDGKILRSMIAGKEKPVFVFGKEINGGNED